MNQSLIKHPLVVFVDHQQNLFKQYQINQSCMEIYNIIKELYIIQQHFPSFRHYDLHPIVED